MRVPDAEDEGGPLERRLPLREAAALEDAETAADVVDACKGVGALRGVVEADGPAEEGPFATVADVATRAPSSSWARGKPPSIGVGDAKMICCRSLCAWPADASCCSDIFSDTVPLVARSKRVDALQPAAGGSVHGVHRGQ